MFPGATNYKKYLAFLELLPDAHLWPHHAYRASVSQSYFAEDLAECTLSLQMPMSARLSDGEVPDGSSGEDAWEAL